MKYAVEFMGCIVYQPEFFTKNGKKYYIGEVPGDSDRNKLYYIWTDNESYSSVHKIVREFLKDNSLSAGQHEQAHLTGDLSTYFQTYHKFSFNEIQDCMFGGHFSYEIVRPYDD